LVYQQFTHGLEACLLVSTGFIFIASMISMNLPQEQPHQ